MKLLYAEDEAAMSEAVADILTFHKYAVDVVDNGEDALEYARSEAYDGIILDIMMPRMDGLTVLRKLRAEGNSTPVLLLTAKAEVADRIEGLDLIIEFSFLYNPTMTTLSTGRFSCRQYVKFRTIFKYILYTIF